MASPGRRRLFRKVSGASPLSASASGPAGHAAGLRPEPRLPVEDPVVRLAATPERAAQRARLEEGLPSPESELALSPSRVPSPPAREPSRRAQSQGPSWEPAPALADPVVRLATTPERRAKRARLSGGSPSPGSDLVLSPGSLRSPPSRRVSGKSSPALLSPEPAVPAGLPRAGAGRPAVPEGTGRAGSRGGRPSSGGPRRARGRGRARVPEPAVPAPEAAGPRRSARIAGRAEGPAGEGRVLGPSLPAGPEVGALPRGRDIPPGLAAQAGSRLRSAGARAAEQRRALAAADLQEQRRAQQRVEDARRGQLEALQGRSVGRLKALGRPVPSGLNRWPLESLSTRTCSPAISARAWPGMNKTQSLN